MSAYLVPVVSVVLIWWLSTGAVVWLARGLDRQMNTRLMVMTAVCALGFAGVIIASSNMGVWTVYLSFFSTILIWGWVEFTLLSGLITGSRTEPCPEHLGEFERFRYAFNAIDHHEYALLAMLIVLAVLDSSVGSGMAIKTFALLWVMRLGAKLTIFSGAPELSTSLIPERLAYMKTYFRHDRISNAFWFSLGGCSVFFAAGIYALCTVQYDAVVQTQVTILTSLAGLAMLEHGFMVLPVSDNRLWGWAMGGDQNPDREFENRATHQTARNKNRQVGV